MNSEESNVRVGKGSMPWHVDEEDGKVYKYQYHPHGDTSKPLRNAPSAMNTVIVPDVTLPEVCKWPTTTTYDWSLVGITKEIGPIITTLQLLSNAFSLLLFRTSTSVLTSTARRSGITKRLL